MLSAGVYCSDIEHMGQFSFAIRRKGGLAQGG